MINKLLTQKRRILIVLLALFMVCCTGLFLSKAVNSRADLILNESLYSEYDVNAEFELPSGEITYQGQTKSATVKLYYPSGKSADANKVILTEHGKYTLCFSAEFDGQTVTEEKYFNVKQNTYSESDGCKVTYGNYKYDNSLRGLHVSLSAGNKFVYNKVLDVTGITSFDTLLRLYPETNVEGVADCETFIVTLTDVYDAENQIKVQVKRSPYVAGFANDYLCYVNTKFTGQTYSAWYYYMENGQYRKNLQISRFGTSVRFSFPSYAQYGGATHAQSYIDFCYDDAGMEMYTVNDPKVVNTAAGSNRQLIADYNDLNMFNEKWKGFTTGEVILSFEADVFTSAQPAGFFITKILDEDLTEFSFADEVDPVITLVKDYGEDFPTGVKGRKYSIVDAIYTDAQSGVSHSGVKVYKNYRLADEEECEVYDNYFIPLSEGNYTIVYFAKDYFGNNVNKEVPIKVYENDQEMFIAYERPTQEYYNVGEIMAIPYANATGGAGDIKVSTCVGLLNSSEVWNITDGEFKPEKSGRYFVAYKAEDYVGNVKVDGFIFEAKVYDGAVFDSVPVLPKYFIAGFAYDLPEIYAYNYVGGSKVAQKATIKVSDAKGTRDLDGNKYTPSVAVNAEQEYVTVTYYVGEKAQSFNVLCVAPVNGKVFNKAGYFVYDKEAVSLSASNNNISVTTSTNLASFEFVNQLLADGFEFTFQIPATKNAFNKLNVYLSDSINANEKIKITIEKIPGDSSSYFYINDGDKYLTKTTFGSDGMFRVCFSNQTKVISDGVSTNLLATKTLNGEIFNGFTSGMCYLSCEFEEVTGESCVVLKTINSAAMNSKTNDPSFPEFALLGSVKYNVKLNEVFNIPVMKAASVLNPTVQCKMTVYLPNGSIATSTDGVLLEDVACDRPYSVVGSQYGNYSVEYIAKDSFNKINEYGFFVTVVDYEKPIINITEDIAGSAKVGETVKVPIIEATDNLNNVTLIRFYKTPNGDIVYLEDQTGFVPQVAGTYVIRYVAYDAFGNTTTRDFKLVVTR